MKSSNAELVSRIEQASAGLTFWSDNDSPFKTFAWKTSEKGNLTIEKLLKSESFIQLLKIDDFIQFVSLDKNWLNSSAMCEYAARASLSAEAVEQAQKMGGKFQFLIELLLSSTSTLEVYKVSILDDGLETEGFHIIIGTKKDGDCIGISPDMLYPLGSSWQSTQSSRCSEPLKLEIKTSVRSVGEDILLLSHYKNT